MCFCFLFFILKKKEDEIHELEVQLGRRSLKPKLVQLPTSREKSSYNLFNSHEMEENRENPRPIRDYFNPTFFSQFSSTAYFQAQYKLRNFSIGAYILWKKY